MEKSKDQDKHGLHTTAVPSTSRRRFLLTFVLLWLTQFMVYCLRKPVGVLKIHLEKSMGVSKAQLGLLDVSLLLPYSLIQIFGAARLDTTFSSPAVLISVCLTIASTAMFISGFMNSVITYCFCLAISGLAQGPMWPGCAKIISKVCPPDKLASVIGFLSTALFTGAFVSTAFASYILEVIDWRHFYTIIVVPALIVAFLVISCIKDSKSSSSSTGVALSETQTGKQRTSSMKDLWKIPTVREITVSLFCLKFVRYALYLWLPLYLNDSLGYSPFQSGLLSTLFDIGGAAGGPILGVLSDRSKGRTLEWIFKACLYTCIALIILVLCSGFGIIVVGTCLLIIGMGNCGSDSILTGPVTTSLGERDGRGQGAGVTALVNGISSTGGIVEGPLLGLISSNIGWNGVLILQIVVSFLAGIAALQAHRIENQQQRNANTNVNANVAETKNVASQLV